MPIVNEGRVVGIVSRRNILQALTQSAVTTRPVDASDAAIREEVLQRVKALPGGKPWLLAVSVVDGNCELWGPAKSIEEKAAIRVAAETTPGVKSVKDQLYYFPL